MDKAAGKPTADQVAIWESFLKKNPENLFAQEARTTLEQLRKDAKFEQGAQPAQQATVPVPPPPAGGAATADVSDLTQSSKDYLDPERAFFLAAVPGLFVPGLGHFYVKRPVMGGILAGVRVTGLIIGAVGIFNNELPVIIPGVVLAVGSWVIDMAGAPMIAYDENAKRELVQNNKVQPFIAQVSGDGAVGGLTIPF